MSKNSTEIRLYVYPQQPATGKWPDYVLEALDALATAAVASGERKTGSRFYVLEEELPDTFYDLRRAASEGYVNLVELHERPYASGRLPWYDASFWGHDSIGKFRSGKGVVLDFDLRPAFMVDAGKGLEGNQDALKEFYWTVIVGLAEVRTVRGKFPARSSHQLPVPRRQ